MPFQPRQVPFEAPLPSTIAFLRDWLSDPACLHETAWIARHQRVCPARALIANGLVSEALYYRALARHLAVEYIADWPMLDLAFPLPEAIARGHVRLAGARSPCWLNAPEGEGLRRLFEGDAPRGRAEIAITSPSHLRAIIQLRYAGDIAHRAREALPEAGPGLSAKRMALWRPRAAMAAVAAVTLVGLAGTPHLVGNGLGLLFFASMGLRLLVCAEGLDQRQTLSPPVVDAELPVYSVLVPLRDETDIVEELIAALARIDYPRAKLEVFILVEPEDRATRGALAALRLPPWCHIIVGPVDNGTLRTKPRALNIGPLFARGSMLTVYDAEDRPDPDQLYLAAARFAGTSERLACLQARLVITNGDKGWLPRQFAIEYAVLFDLFNIGIAALRLPLALGGTSNHFRTAALRAVGGWDAWNVTEDADLGFRLARFGYQVGTVGSTTSEDAPEKVSAWMRQRRRWTKGWLQILLVLAWNAGDAWRHYGPVKSLFVGLMLTNLVIGPPLLPLFIASIAYHLVRQGLPDVGSLPRLAEATLAASVGSLGMGSTLWASYSGMRIRRLGAFMSSVPLLLPYQLMISAAAWAGLFDLLRDPFHWHKTEHGRAARRRPTP